MKIFQWESCVQVSVSLLTVDQKQQRHKDSERCLQLFRRNEKEFLRRYLTMDEKLIHQFTPESNCQSPE